jgi:hypothetical protein
VTRRFAVLPVLIALCLALLAPPALALPQPNVNPSTAVLWTGAPVGCYRDTMFVMAANDSARWTPGFVFDTYTLVGKSKPTQVRLVGKSTLQVDSSYRSEIPLGPGKGRPIFDSILWELPANSSDHEHIEGLRGYVFKATVADTFIVRSWVQD